MRVDAVLVVLSAFVAHVTWARHHRSRSLFEGMDPGIGPGMGPSYPELNDEEGDQARDEGVFVERHVDDGQVHVGPRGRGHGTFTIDRLPTRGLEGGWARPGGRRGRHRDRSRARQRNMRNKEVRARPQSSRPSRLRNYFEALSPPDEMFEDLGEWLSPNLQGRLQIGPSIDVNWDFSHWFGGSQSNWWEGPNVDVLHEEREEGVGPEDGVEISNHAVISTTRCMETQATYKCESTVITQGKKKVFTTTYQCKYGYTRAEGASGCTQELTLVNLAETARVHNLTKLLEAVDGVGITDIITNGNFTIFAPTDEAFEAFATTERVVGANPSVVYVGPDSLEMVNSIKDTLAAHLVEGFRTSVSFEDEELVDTANPMNRIRLNIYDVPEKTVTANCAKVTSIDNLATNGVVHVIDRVLQPVTKTILDIISQDSNFSTLASALDKAELATSFAGEGQFTFFAPTNEAFQLMDPELLQGLLANRKCLTKLLHNHVLENVICSAIIQGRAKTRNVLDKYLTLKWEGERVRVEGSYVTSADIMATNGVIHIIDQVLVPSEARDALAVAAEVGVSTVLSLLEQTGLDQKLRGADSITMFLPTNQAFEELPQTTRDRLNSDPDLLASVLSHHVIQGELIATDLRDGRELRTLKGDTVRAKLYTSFPFSHRQVKVVQCARVVTADVDSCNGVVHLIDKVLLPPTGDVVATLQQDGRFNSLVSFIRKARLENELSSGGPFTLFAPTDQAFRELDEDILSELNRDPDLLKNVLLHHVISEIFCCAGAFPMSYFYTPRERALDGSYLPINRGRNHVWVDQISVTECDVMATNGVIQVVDDVLPGALETHLRLDVERGHETPHAEGPVNSRGYNFFRRMREIFGS